MSSRHQSALREIDAARCVGNWKLASSLAAKLAKHETFAFTTIVSCEAELEEYLLAVEWDPQEHWKDDCAVYKVEGRTVVTACYPMNIASSSEKLGLLERRLLKTAKHTMTSEEEYQRNVVLAKVYFYGSNFEKCRETIEPLSTAMPKTCALSPSYTTQLFMAQMVMRGICLEVQGDISEAYSTYEAAVRAYKDKLSGQAAMVVPRGSEPGAERGQHEELVNWAEEALYRRATMSLALNDKATNIRKLESYINAMDSVTPPAFRAFRRLRANRLYMQLMRQSLDSGTAPSAEMKRAVMLGHRRQLWLLKATYAFPRADEVHEEVLSEVDSVARDWGLVRAFARADCLQLLEILYEFVCLTFNSPRVLRHLIHALIRFGDYHEAALALGTYRELVERQLEGVKKAIDAAVREGTGGANVFAGDVESINHVLRTAAVGARLLLVHLENVHECLALVHFADSLISDIEKRDPERLVTPAVPQAVRAQIALWKGAAHSRLAQKSRDPGNRADHHNAALQHLREATALGPRLYDAHYYLALEYALGALDIPAATAAAKQAAALDSHRLEAWHLLALLYTARKDYEKALQICEVAMRQSDWWDVYSEIKNDADSQRPQTSAHMGSIETGIDFFKLAMTHTAIEGRRRGFDASIEAQPRLFALYGYVYGPVVAAAEDSDDVSTALETSSSIDMLATDELHTASRRGPPSQASGRRSLARSLARSVFSKHARHVSHDGRPPLPFTPLHGGTAPDTDPAAPKATVDTAPTSSGSHSAQERPKRQRSMPHLRPSTQDKLSSDALFDDPGRLVGRASIHGSGSVYYTPVATRQRYQRAQAKNALCSLWLSTAAAFVALQRLDEATHAVTEALAVSPQSPAALTMRGQLELARGQQQAALSDFHEAVALEANNVRASVALARIEHELGRRDEALALLKTVSRAQGWSDPEAWLWLGRLERELALEHAEPARAQMLRRALEFTAYALDLECSQPVVSFSVLWV
ncbi:hypothetical protein H4R22_002873 [Coemansia sp. RSA 1290]|nr:hypothetical protein H4R22_002873 [Coemansia sp. RSA 1290]